MASLLRDPRGDLVLGGSVLSAITVATALPRLPVRDCAGYEPRAGDADAARRASSS